MDDVERYCDTNIYWSPKKKINPKNDAIDTWYKELELDIHDSQQQEIFCCDANEIRDRNVGYRGTVL